jgi:hypothetical protein
LHLFSAARIFFAARLSGGGLRRKRRHKLAASAPILPLHGRAMNEGARSGAFGGFEAARMSKIEVSGALRGPQSSVILDTLLQRFPEAMYFYFYMRCGSRNPCIRT